MDTYNTYASSIALHWSEVCEARRDEADSYMKYGRVGTQSAMHFFGGWLFIMYCVLC